MRAGGTDWKQKDRSLPYPQIMEPSRCDDLNHLHRDLCLSEDNLRKDILDNILIMLRASRCHQIKLGLKSVIHKVMVFKNYCKLHANKCFQYT